MKVIFLSGLYPKAIEGLLLENCRNNYLQNAPNEFQWGIVDGLIQNKVSALILSCPFLGTYPLHFQLRRVPEYRASLSKEVQLVSIGYNAIMGLKPLSIERHIRKEIEAYITDDNEDYFIIAYSTISYMLAPIIKIKASHQNVHLATIVTDLVDNALLFKDNQKFPKRFFINREIETIKEQYSHIDKFILLSAAMTEKIPAAIGKNKVLEGIWHESDIQASQNLTDIKLDQKTILYAGTIQPFAGINDFVDAFVKTSNPNYRLIICGAGSSEAYIQQKVKEDSRIIFKGRQPHQYVIQLQRAATLVVNPRKPDEEITRYSFPSKTIEYLASGTPMMGYHLEGIPQEYYTYMFTPTDLSIEAMAQEIDKVLSLPKNILKEKGEKAQAFIQSEKNSKVQVEKILRFLQE